MNVTGNISLGVPKFATHHGRGPGHWVSRAACTGLNPNLWFRDEHDGTSYREARQICAGCQVTNECLAWALETNTEHGVFGGLSPRERKHLRRSPRRRRATSADGHGYIELLWAIALFLAILLMLRALGWIHT